MLFFPLFCAFFSLFQAVGLTFDGDNLCMVDKAFDQGDDTGGVGEDLVPTLRNVIGSGISLQQCSTVEIGSTVASVVHIRSLLLPLAQST